MKICLKKVHILLLVFSLILTSCVPDEGQTSTQKNTSPPLSITTGWWNPLPGLTWQWHLSDLPIDTSINVDVYNIDLFDNDESLISELHKQGRKVICYISVGSWEDWRPDAGQFPEEVLGNDYSGWPGEKWMDIRRIDLLAPIMLARLDLCKEKGFDAVEPDNLEIHNNDTGFPITYQDQLTYAKWLADEAHSRGLAIGLKNAPDMVVDSLPYFDFAITEDAYYYGWIEEMIPFIETGKPVFAAEYTDLNVDFLSACAWGEQNHVNFIQKDRALTAYRTTCP